MNGSIGWGLLGLAMGFLAVSAHAEYRFELGGEMTRGDYGTAETSTVWSVPVVGLRYQGERAFWSLSLPYLFVEAPSDFVVTSGGGGRGHGGGGTGQTSTRTTTRTVSGLGDLTASLGWSVLEGSDDRPWLAVGGEVKFATADENENLGTGENDYAVQLAAGRGWLHGRLGYRWLGDTATNDYEDPLYAAVGATHLFASGADLGVEWYGEQAVVPGGDPRQEVTLYGSYPVREALRMQGYVFTGFTDASADLGGGIGFSFAL